MQSEDDSRRVLLNAKRMRKPNSVGHSLHGDCETRCKFERLAINPARRKLSHPHAHDVIGFLRLNFVGCCSSEDKSQVTREGGRDGLDE